MLTLHLDHFNFRILLDKLFDVTVATADTDDQLTVEDLCGYLLATKLILTLVLSS